MKTVMFLLAVAGMFAFAACNNQTAENTEDTTAQTEVEAPAQEPVEEVNPDAVVEEGDVAQENAETPAEPAK